MSEEKKTLNFWDVEGEMYQYARDWDTRWRDPQVMEEKQEKGWLEIPCAYSMIKNIIDKSIQMFIISILPETVPHMRDDDEETHIRKDERIKTISELTDNIEKFHTMRKD